MNRQQQIEQFLMAAHHLALERLRAQPARLADVTAQLQRWRERAGPNRSDPYWDEWDVLLAGGVDVIERAVAGASDHAAALRSVSPVSVLITQGERAQLLRHARRSA